MMNLNYYRAQFVANLNYIHHSLELNYIEQHITVNLSYIGHN